MNSVIQQLKRQGISTTHMGSVYTAHIPAQKITTLTLNVTKPIRLAFAVGVGATLSVIERWRRPITVADVILSLGSESRVEYFIDGSRYTSRSINYQVYTNRATNFNLYAYFKSITDFSGQLAVTQQKPGSTANLVVGLNLAGGSSNLELINRHKSQHTSGDIFLKCLGQGHAVAEINGLIKIDPHAAFTNSYLTENVLLLSKEAEIKANPNLEILNNEVKASHSATVGRLDDQILYYLMSRGLNKHQATNLLVNGFFKPLIEAIQDSSIGRAYSNALSIV